MNKSDRIYVAGHRGMVGSAILRLLQSEGYNNLILATSKELDLRNQAAVENFFRVQKPDYVFLAAAKVGGIQANNIYRAEFLFDNLAIELNVIHSAYQHGTKKLLFLGSSCIYPKDAPQPLKESYLLTGPLEKTNEPYAIAKIAGIKLCESFRDQFGANFISAMPTNLYGPNDNYDLNNSHVLPALIRKFHEARINGAEEVEVWGSGKPLREFLYVDDLAKACLHLMLYYNEREFVNVGYGKDISIADLAKLISEITGFKGKISFNTTKPDGTYRKLMDITKITGMGWKPETELRNGLKKTYEHFLNEVSVTY
ncbi:MAG: GDP-L-fucose synthase [Bacteroidetes bacterium]|nr:MAG: GDP-L-fucose synthase [Bacteroidota bacterium]REJ99725.1 MAG: GDP-L-fucose synthase [Bacteroidota bacterium]REK32919.1 MAG: GDP-L-fucose synthase [Bacteroidota bacterium]REK47724.1 MAG: GDP-L-fucose synthase [Bacteroidota bacterium]